MRSLHSLGSEAAQTSTSASITSPIGACWLTKNTPGRTAACQKRPEVPRHCLMIVRYEDSILVRSERENVRIRNSL